MIPRLPKGFSHPMTIGEGSFSSVYRVRQEVLDRWVAIKVLHEKNAAQRLELLHEARTQAQMSVSCIPAVYDAFSKGPRIFIVMEWIKGASLQALLEQGLPHAGHRAALAAAIVASLAELHKLGYAHRDLKPANILVSPENGVYLVDFGFAKRVGEGGRSMAGMVKGTPAYMAPEIWQGNGDMDFIKADLFALGKILEELRLGPEYVGLVKPLLSAAPAGRPPSAVALRRDWEARARASETVEWKSLAGALASKLLCGRLLQAAKQLLFARRKQEAYWLLVECLQEDPDSAEAMRLMENFPTAPAGRIREKWVWASASAAVLAAAVIVAFHFGRQTERLGRRPMEPDDERAKALLLPPRPDIRGGGRRSGFRDIGRGGSRLSGTVFLQGAFGCDSLLLDARSLARPEADSILEIPTGEHALACLDPRGNVRRERFHLLPFQRKIINFRPVHPES